MLKGQLSGVDMRTEETFYNLFFHAIRNYILA